MTKEFKLYVNDKDKKIKSVWFVYEIDGTSTQMNQMLSDVLFSYYALL
jgi:hypothetical protein